MASFQQAGCPCPAGRQVLADAIQSRFLQPKPVIELFDVHEDPGNVHNLPGDLAQRIVTYALEHWPKRAVVE